MNERIKELALHAGAGRRAGVAGLVFRDSELEKFAELIVRECADLVQKYMSRFPEDHELTKQIKEHFGVEE